MQHAYIMSTLLVYLYGIHTRKNHSSAIPRCAISLELSYKALSFVSQSSQLALQKISDGSLPTHSLWRDKVCQNPPPQKKKQTPNSSQPPGGLVFLFFETKRRNSMSVKRAWNPVQSWQWCWFDSTKFQDGKLMQAQQWHAFARIVFWGPTYFLETLENQKSYHIYLKKDG